MSAPKLNRMFLSLGLAALISAPVIYFGGERLALRLASLHSADVVVEAPLARLEFVTDAVESARAPEDHDIYLSVYQVTPPGSSPGSGDQSFKGHLAVVRASRTEAITRVNEVTEQVREALYRQRNAELQTLIPARTVPVLGAGQTFVLWTARFAGVAGGIYGLIVLLVTWIERDQRTPPALPAEQAAQEQATRYDY